MQTTDSSHLEKLILAPFHIIKSWSIRFCGNSFLQEKIECGVVYCILFGFSFCMLFDVEHNQRYFFTYKGKGISIFSNISFSNMLSILPYRNAGLVSIAGKILPVISSCVSWPIKP